MRFFSSLLIFVVLESLYFYFNFATWCVFFWLMIFFFRSISFFLLKFSGVSLLFHMVVFSSRLLWAFGLPSLMILFSFSFFFIGELLVSFPSSCLVKNCGCLVLCEFILIWVNASCDIEVAEALKELRMAFVLEAWMLQPNCKVA